MMNKNILIHAKGELWREIFKNINTIEAYVKILLDC